MMLTRTSVKSFHIWTNTFTRLWHFPLSSSSGRPSHNQAFFLWFISFKTLESYKMCLISFNVLRYFLAALLICYDAQTNHNCRFISLSFHSFQKLVDYVIFKEIKLTKKPKTLQRFFKPQTTIKSINSRLCSFVPWISMIHLTKIILVRGQCRPPLHESDRWWLFGNWRAMTPWYR